MASAYFSTVVVFESLPEGQLRTGRSLRDDIEPVSAFHARGINVDYRKVNNRLELNARLADVLHGAEHGDYPLLHFESHGSERGIELADGSHIAWAELKPWLISINVATRCNLIVIVGACYGGYLAQTLLPTDRAPCWPLIGPSRT